MSVVDRNGSQVQHLRDIETIQTILNLLQPQTSKGSVSGSNQVSHFDCGVTSLLMRMDLDGERRGPYQKDFEIMPLTYARIKDPPEPSFGTLESPTMPGIPRYLVDRYLSDTARLTDISTYTQRNQSSWIWARRQIIMIVVHNS